MPKTNRVVLNDKRVAASKTKPGRASTDLFDAVVPGLVLRVTRAGRRMFYTWHRDAAKKIKWTLVRDPQLTSYQYPALTLARARELAREILEKAGAGRDPGAEGKLTRARTFGMLCDQYIEHWAMPRKKTWRADALDIRTQLHAWKDRPVATIRRSDVRELLDGIVARGAKIRANRIQSLISKILNFGLDREWVEANVAAKMAKPSAEGKRTRKLSATEIRAFWQWLERTPPADYDETDAGQWRLNRALLKLRLITAQRGNEILGMQWSDLDWHERDHGPWWTVPNTKNGRPHRVPLTKPAIKVLRDLQRRATDADGYVFTGIRGKRQRRQVLVDLPVKDFLPRDLRRTATSEMASLGVDRFVVKRVLNHVDQEVTADYDLYAYGAEKRAALDQWATRLQTMTKPLRVVRKRRAA